MIVRKKPRGKVGMLVGTAASGKNTIAEPVRKELDLAVTVSCADRNMRPGEIDGVHYHFVLPEEFTRREQAGLFVESFEVRGSRKGTLRSDLDALLDSGKHVMFDIDVQGARKLKSFYPQFRTIFVISPYSELRERIERRGGTAKGQIDLDLAKACEEIKAAYEADYFILNRNGHLEEAIQDLTVLMSALIEGRRPPNIPFRDINVLDAVLATYP